MAKKVTDYQDATNDLDKALNEFIQAIIYSTPLIKIFNKFGLTVKAKYRRDCDWTFCV